MMMKIVTALFLCVWVNTQSIVYADDKNIKWFYKNENSNKIVYKDSQYSSRDKILKAYKKKVESDGKITLSFLLKNESNNVDQVSQNKPYYLTHMRVEVNKDDVFDLHLTELSSRKTYVVQFSYRDKSFGNNIKLFLTDDINYTTEYYLEREKLVKTNEIPISYSKGSNKKTLNFKKYSIATKTTNIEDAILELYGRQNIIYIDGVLNCNMKTPYIESSKSHGFYIDIISNEDLESIAIFSTTGTDKVLASIINNIPKDTIIDYKGLPIGSVNKNGVVVLIVKDRKGNFYRTNVVKIKHVSSVEDAAIPRLGFNLKLKKE